jgi:hypothetical protein
MRSFAFALVAVALVGLGAACSSSSSGGNGSTAQALVGSPCTKDSDCGAAPFFCHLGDHPGGYCMRDCNIAHGDADCPSEAICQFDGTTGECHAKCGAQSDCRSGYECSPASNASDNMASHSYCDVPGMSMGGDGGMDGMDGMAGMDGMSGMDGMPGMDM